MLSLLATPAPRPVYLGSLDRRVIERILERRRPSLLRCLPPGGRARLDFLINHPLGTATHVYVDTSTPGAARCLQRSLTATRFPLCGSGFTRVKGFPVKRPY